jgi:hypothetical protein
MDACAPRVVFAIVSLGVLVSACSGPSGPSPLPSRTAPALPATALPSTSGVSWLRVSPEQGAPGSAVSLDVACLDTLGVVHGRPPTVASVRSRHCQLGRSPRPVPGFRDLRCRRALHRLHCCTGNLTR